MGKKETKKKDKTLKKVLTRKEKIQAIFASVDK